ncbi:MAG: hypothetical protein MJ032_02350 [Acidaminococcaceae bacterium]|nr:hypothetical protein [Acidaminococcaceae bacterium]
MKKLVLAVVAMLVMAVSCVFAAKHEPQVNWDRGLQGNVEVYGLGSPLDYTGYKGSRIGRESAIMDGVRNLTAFVNTIHVDAHLTVGDLVASNDGVKSGVSDLIRSAKIAAEGKNPDGTYWARLSLPLYGNNSLADVVIPAVAAQSGKAKVAKLNKKNSIIGRAGFEGVERDFYTGLVIDARGLGLNCAFAPVIYDTAGRYIFGARFVNINGGNRGIVEYVRNSATINTGRSRAGDSPLVVKAETVRGGYAANMVDIVVSEEDGDRILLANNMNGYIFNNCAVVVMR